VAKMMKYQMVVTEIGILAFRQLSGIAAFYKIVTRFYHEKKGLF
jgi:hypothetical protein